MCFRRSRARARVVLCFRRSRAISSFSCYFTFRLSAVVASLYPIQPLVRARLPCTAHYRLTIKSSNATVGTWRFYSEPLIKPLSVPLPVQSPNILNVRMPIYAPNIVLIILTIRLGVFCAYILSVRRIKIYLISNLSRYRKCERFFKMPVRRSSQMK